MTDSLFQRFAGSLSSGIRSPWKIECDVLTPEDWDVLAMLAVEILPPFSSVHPVPRGGDPFAQALRQYTSITKAPPLVCDDVLTTGESMTNMGEQVLHETGVMPNGIVAFSRTHYIPSWIRAVWARGAGSL